jgi:hypothetical protein
MYTTVYLLHLQKLWDMTTCHTQKVLKGKTALWVRDSNTSFVIGCSKVDPSSFLRETYFFQYIIFIWYMKRH